jgi:hypothetical protein
MDVTTTDARLDGLVRTLQDAPGAFALFATTIDQEADGPWARVNLEVDLSSPPVQYVPPLSLPTVHPLVACPGVVAAGSGTAIPSTVFRPSDVLPSSSASPASLPTTGAAAAGAIAAVLILGAVALRHLSRAADVGP